MPEPTGKGGSSSQGAKRPVAPPEDDLPMLYPEEGPAAGGPSVFVPSDSKAKSPGPVSSSGKGRASPGGGDAYEVGEPPPVLPATPSAGSVFQPVKAGPPAGAKNGGAKTAGGESVFPPPPRSKAPKAGMGSGARAAMGREAAGRARSSAPPRVGHRYDRNREVAPILAGATVGLVISIALMWDPGLVGIVGLLTWVVWLIYRFALILPHPVRVTPEQAVREFLDSLGHLMPNFRRMYLLLTSEGQEAFGSFGAFRAYWQWRRCQVMASDWVVKAVRYEIANFQTQYNAERTLADVQFTLTLFVPGQPDKAIRRPVTWTLVKGQRDGSWYLNDGMLP